MSPIRSRVSTIPLQCSCAGVRSHMRTSLHSKFPANREFYREICASERLRVDLASRNLCAAATSQHSLSKLTGKAFQRTGNFILVSGNFNLDGPARSPRFCKRPFLAHFSSGSVDTICSRFDLQMRSARWRTRTTVERQGEAFWRAHHEAWKRSDLNQREYCEAQGIPLKAFGNWRAKFKAEPQPPERSCSTDVEA